MVEFGLKLEDNKVSEWSDYYIDYEKLKAILKKAKSAQKKYDDQAHKRPAEAQKILEAFHSGVANYVTVTPSQSAANLAVAGTSNRSTPNQSSNNLVKEEQKAVQHLAADERKIDSDHSHTNVTNNDEPSETTRLLGSNSSAESPHETQRHFLPNAPNPTVQDSFHSTDAHESEQHTQSTFRTGFSLSDYFGSRYERNLRESLKEIEKSKTEFDTLLNAEIDKIRNFYSAKLDELERRLELLLDNVADSFDVELPSAAPESDSGNEQNGSKDKPSLMAFVHRVSTIIKAETQAKLQNLRLRDPTADEDDELYEQNGLHSLKLTDDSKIAETDSIQRALVDQYRTAKLLHNYVIMNYTGLVKIVKKHDKTIPSSKGMYKAAVEAKNLCNEGEEVDQFAAKLEKFYANWFCDGNIREAHAQMLPKRGDGLEMDWSQLRLGYRMGMCAVLGIWVCWDCVWGLVSNGNSTIGGRTAFPVFRACGGLLLLQWFWGCSVFIWTRYRVNYIYLFDFNPRIVSTALGVFEEAVDNTLIFLVIMLLYYKSGAHDIPEILPAGGYPLILVLITVFRLIFPLRTRLPMWNAIWQVISSPLNSPNFFHGYVGDIFTSMVKVFQDVAWTAGYMLSGDFLVPEDLEASTKHAWSKTFWYKNVLIPVICLLPLIFRFNQCLRRYIDTKDRWPHLANAFKYALSQTVTLFGAFHPLYLEHTRATAGGLNSFQLSWLFIFVSSSLYSFTWDVYMDWGLGRPKFGYLGPSLMYPKRSNYYLVIALDLVLRFMWVLTLVPPQSGAKFEVPQYLSAMTMMLELFRRTIWGFLRLENEHRSNAAGYRRVGVVPLHFNTGHKHQYKEERHRRGLSVLSEVTVIALAVVGVCVYSVVAAQKANRFVDMKDL